MIVPRKEIIAFGKSILKIIPFIFLFFICSISKAAFTADSTRFTSIDTDSSEFLVDKDSLVFPTDSMRFLQSQKTDSSHIDIQKNSSITTKNKKNKKVDTTHYSPKKAAIWGAAFPGLGQVYNKKYWKLPIVYGVLGTVIYFVASNGIKLKKFNGYIRNIYDSIPNPSPYNTLGLSEIETFRDGYRKNLQIACFGTIFAWGLSIVDAVVDAHLRHFDISDKLTLKIKPELNYSNFTYYAGIGLHLNFK